jgi:hypothetical protein
MNFYRQIFLLKHSNLCIHGIENFTRIPKCPHLPFYDFYIVFYGFSKLSIKSGICVLLDSPEGPPVISTRHVLQPHVNEQGDFMEAELGKKKAKVGPARLTARSPALCSFVEEGRRRACAMAGLGVQHHAKELPGHAEQREGALPYLRKGRRELPAANYKVGRGGEEG